MKNIRVSFSERYQPTPVSFWVHRNLNSDVWVEASQFHPPLPKAVPGKGFVRVHVECNGVELVFASVYEIDHVIAVLDRNPLPTTRRLSADRDSEIGPNSHWLSRLPGKAKSARARKDLVRLLGRARDQFVDLA